MTGVRGDIVNLALANPPRAIGSIRTMTPFPLGLPERHKKRKLWDLDPSNFEQGRKGSFFERRVVPPLRQITKLGLYALAITYPIYFVYVGLAFGGLVFWTFFAGSIAVMGTIITRLGYASNFRHWDISLKRTVGVLLGFVIATGFYGGLIYLKIWFLPIAVGLGGLGVLLVLIRSKF